MIRSRDECVIYLFFLCFTLQHYVVHGKRDDVQIKLKYWISDRAFLACMCCSSASKPADKIVSNRRYESIQILDRSANGGMTAMASRWH